MISDHVVRRSNCFVGDFFYMGGGRLQIIGKLQESIGVRMWLGVSEC